MRNALLCLCVLTACGGAVPEVDSDKQAICLNPPCNGQDYAPAWVKAWSGNSVGYYVLSNGYTAADGFQRTGQSSVEIDFNTVATKLGDGLDTLDGIVIHTTATGATEIGAQSSVSPNLFIDIDTHHTTLLNCVSSNFTITQWGTVTKTFQQGFCPVGNSQYQLTATATGTAILTCGIGAVTLSATWTVYSDCSPTGGTWVCYDYQACSDGLHKVLGNYNPSTGVCTTNYYAC